MLHALHPAIEAIRVLLCVLGDVRPNGALGVLPTSLCSVSGKGVGIEDDLVANGRLLPEAQPIRPA